MPATRARLAATPAPCLPVQMPAVVFGQRSVSAADPGSYTLFVMISVIVSLSFLPILLVTLTPPVHETSRPTSDRELVTLSPSAWVGMRLPGTVFATMYGTVAAYATAADALPIAHVNDRIETDHLVVFPSCEIGKTTDDGATGKRRAVPRSETGGAR